MCTNHIRKTNTDAITRVVTAVATGAISGLQSTTESRKNSTPEGANSPSLAGSLNNSPNGTGPPLLHASGMRAYCGGQLVARFSEPDQPHSLASCLNLTNQLIQIAALKGNLG
jgi:hypothetical protein